MFDVLWGNTLLVKNATCYTYIFPSSISKSQKTIQGITNGDLHDLVGFHGALRPGFHPSAGAGPDLEQGAEALERCDVDKLRKGRRTAVLRTPFEGETSTACCSLGDWRLKHHVYIWNHRQYTGL